MLPHSAQTQLVSPHYMGLLFFGVFFVLRSYKSTQRDDDICASSTQEISVLLRNVICLLKLFKLIYPVEKVICIQVSVLNKFWQLKKIGTTNYISELRISLFLMLLNIHLSKTYLAAVSKALLYTAIHIYHETITTLFLYTSISSRPQIYDLVHQVQYF